MHGVESELKITQAVRRSRRMRAALQRRRRRSTALAACLAVALAGGTVWSIGALSGNDMVEAAVSQAKNLADLLAQRSPGQRVEAQLTKTKHARILAKHQLGRPAAFAPRPASVSPPPFAQMIDLPAVSIAPPDLERPLAQFALSTPPTLGGIVSGPPGGSPPSGGPNPIGPPASPPREIVPLPSAVPEPGSWATMLLGFALVGWRLRRRRAPGAKGARALHFEI